MRGMKKKLAVLLALALIFGAVPNLPVKTVMNATAAGSVSGNTTSGNAGPNDVGAEAFTKDEQGNMVLEINPGNIAQYQGKNDITVPGGYMLVISGVTLEITGRVFLEYDAEKDLGASLNIFNDFETESVGKLVGGLEAEDGCTVMFGDPINAPDGMEFYEEDGETKIDVPMPWTTFVFADGKWKVTFGPMTGVDTVFEGLRVDTEEGPHDVSYRVLYSFDDGNEWFNPYSEDPENLNEYCVVEPEYMGDDGMVYRNFEWGEAPEDWDGDLTVQLSIKDTPIAAGNASKVISRAARGIDEKELIDLMNPEVAELSNEGTTLTYTFNPDDGVTNVLYYGLTYPNEGNGNIVDEVNDWLYAYSYTDFDKNGDIDDEDMKEALSWELFDRFINDAAMYGDFMIGEPGQLKDRIELAPDGNIAVTDKDGVTGNCKKYKATIHWGYDYLGYPIVSEVPVYQTPQAEDILICTDFNLDNGTGSKFYIRTYGVDEVEFSKTEDDRGLLVLDDYKVVVAGGNGSYTSYMNTEDMYSFEMYTPKPFEEICHYTAKVRVLNPVTTYVAIHGEGETKDIGGIGANGSVKDAIWATGEKAVADLYIGHTTLHIEPLAAGVGLDTYVIKGVALKDATQKDGVTVDATDLSDIKVDFKSNFYDSVPLVITYGDGSTKEITINRVGLVIRYEFLSGEKDFDIGDDTGEIFYDCKPGTNSFTYNYYKGDQIVVFATYYHPSNDVTSTGGDDLYLNIKYDDGHNEILYHKDATRNFDGYLDETPTAVATTTFLIGFVPAAEWDGEAWISDNGSDFTFKNRFGNEGGISATVINAGYDSKTTYSGTQAGSGKGAYWDGQIHWSRR